MLRRPLAAGSTAAIVLFSTLVLATAGCEFGENDSIDPQSPRIGEETTDCPCNDPSADDANGENEKLLIVNGWVTYQGDREILEAIEGSADTLALEQLHLVKEWRAQVDPVIDSSLAALAAKYTQSTAEAERRLRDTPKSLGQDLMLQVAIAVDQRRKSMAFDSEAKILEFAFNLEVLEALNKRYGEETKTSANIRRLIREVREALGVSSALSLS